MSSETSGFDSQSCSSCSYSSDYYSDYYSDYCSSCSMNTTPHRRGVSAAGYTVDEMKAELQRDVTERFINKNVNVSDFLHHVLGLSEQTIKTIGSAAEKIKSSLTTTLVDAYRSKFDTEPKAYEPFLKISDHLLGVLNDILPAPDTFNQFRTGNVGCIIKNGHNLRKPDVVVALQSAEEITWSNVIAPFEFKTRDNRSRARKSRARVLAERSVSPSSRTRLSYPQSAPVGHSRHVFRDETTTVPREAPHASHEQSVRSSVTAVALPGPSSIPPGSNADNASVTAVASSSSPSKPRNIVPTPMPPGNNATGAERNTTVIALPSPSSSSMPPGNNAARDEPSNVVDGAVQAEFRSRQPRSRSPSSTKAHSSTSKRKSSPKPSSSRASSTSSARVNLNRESKHKPKPIEPQLSSSRKRKASDPPLSASRKRQNRRPTIKADHIQLARYTLECMAAASRHYSTGVLVDRFDISLWYYDRAIVAQTIPFNFEEQPHTLAMVLYALRTCNPRQAGFDPFIIPASQPCPSNIDQLFGTPISVKQSEGDQFVLILDDGSIARFKLTGERLFANRGLLGRGTSVFPVQKIDESDSTVDGELVLKTIWPDSRRMREAEVIRKLRKAIPEMADHLPEVICSADMTAADVRLPRHLLGISVVEEHERRFHALVMSRLKALWMVDSVEEFQDVFVDCVECHYAAYQRGRVLHRDLSINNLMCKKEPSRHLGILSDWDLASLIDEQNAVIASNAKHRTGTVPFMSINLLEGNSPHKYCHDLESFFYILVWASVHFDLREKRCVPQKSCFEDWNKPDLRKAAQPKAFFLRAPEMISPCVSEDFKNLFLAWINPLREMFNNAYNIDGLGLETKIWDTAAFNQAKLERLEEYITFDTFMAAIGREPRREL